MKTEYKPDAQASEFPLAPYLNERAQTADIEPRPLGSGCFRIGVSPWGMRKPLPYGRGSTASVL